MARLRKFVRVDGSIPVMINADQVTWLSAYREHTRVHFEKDHRITVIGSLDQVASRLETSAFSTAVLPEGA
jgi:hypothetical protein